MQRLQRRGFSFFPPGGSFSLPRRQPQSERFHCLWHGGNPLRGFCGESRIFLNRARGNIALLVKAFSIFLPLLTFFEEFLRRNHLHLKDKHRWEMVRKNHT